MVQSFTNVFIETITRRRRQNNLIKKKLQQATVLRARKSQGITGHTIMFFLSAFR